MKKITLSLVLFCILTGYSRVQTYSTYGAPGTTVNVTVVNPKYSLPEAIQLAIKQLEALGQEVTPFNVERILRKMSNGDVVLPKKGNLRDSIRAAVQIYQNEARVQRVSQSTAPNPNAFSTYTRFEAAWMRYKFSLLSPSDIKQLNRTIEGANGYKKQLRKEAQQMWQSR